MVSAVRLATFAHFYMLTSLSNFPRWIDAAKVSAHSRYTKEQCADEIVHVQRYSRWKAACLLQVLEVMLYKHLAK